MPNTLPFMLNPLYGTANHWYTDTLQQKGNFISWLSKQHPSQNEEEIIWTYKVSPWQNSGVSRFKADGDLWSKHLEYIRIYIYNHISTWCFSRIIFWYFSQHFQITYHSPSVLTQWRLWRRCRPQRALRPTNWRTRFGGAENWGGSDFNGRFSND